MHTSYVTPLDSWTGGQQGNLCGLQYGQLQQGTQRVPHAHGHPPVGPRERSQQGSALATSCSLVSNGQAVQVQESGQLGASQSKWEHMF